MAVERRLERIYQHHAEWAYRTLLGNPRTRRGLEKARTAFRVTAESETQAASLFSGVSLWSGVRQGGIEPNQLPGGSHERHKAMERIGIEWVRRFVVEYRDLGLDLQRMTFRALLHNVDTTSVFTGKNALRAAMEEFPKSGDLRRLDYGARDAMRSIGAAGEWMATLDAAAAALGENDSQQVELRRKLNKDLAELTELVLRARPLLEQHGLAQDLIAEVSDVPEP